MPRASDTLVRTLAGLLAEALARDPGLASDSETLAQRIAPDLERRLAASHLDLDPPGEPDEVDDDAPANRSPRDRVLAAISRHPAGRAPGLPPDALCSLTGLPLALLGETVSSLVQSGDLIRDAWLVRIPESGDLLPHARTPAIEQSREPDSLDSERRAIGDRRRLGERRLYERRH